MFHIIDGTLFRLQATLMSLRKKNADSKHLEEAKARPMRADARLKMAAVVQAATEVFAASGVDAPVRAIAERAGVGLGTVYRHFPQRSDLIAAVMKTQVDACADAATTFAAKYEPGEALARWLHRLMDFFGTKRGLAAALHSGNSAYSALPTYFMERMHAAIGGLIKAAVEAKAVRSGIDGNDLLWAVGSLCHGPNGEEPAYAREMVNLLMDGLRYGANKRPQRR
jgi:AcrR family transcriptional regulator